MTARRALALAEVDEMLDRGVRPLDGLAALAPGRMHAKVSMPADPLPNADAVDVVETSVAGAPAFALRVLAGRRVLAEAAVPIAMLDAALQLLAAARAEAVGKYGAGSTRPRTDRAWGACVARPRKTKSAATRRGGR